MTNEMIILIEKERLVKEGILKYTGNVIKGMNLAGEEVEIPEIEPIHTFAVWNKLGYKIKKGEHPKCKFRIWFRDKRKKKEEIENEEQKEEERKPGFYMALASWYTTDQVELKPKKQDKNN